MSKEENIEEFERKSKLVQISGKVSQSVKDDFDELREQGGYETFSLFMEALVERYKNPLKVNKENLNTIAELKKTITELRSEVQEKMTMIERESQSMEDYKAQYEELKAKYEDLSKANLQQAGRLEELDGLQHKLDGHILVPVNELDMRCLEYLASREAKLRKREDITPAVFFQYAVREMLIKGNKFAIDSVPDSVIAKFKQDINNGK